MIGKIYLICLRIFGGESNWKKSKLRMLFARIRASFLTSTFNLKYLRGLYYKGTTITVTQRHPKNFFDYLFDIRNLFRVYLPFLECNVGMVCTLRCQKCNQCNYLLHDTEFFDIDEVISNFNKIMNSIDFVESVSIAGGEALCAPGVERLITAINRCDKVGCLIFVTNGTVIPTEPVFEALKNSKTQLSISNYPLQDEFLENRNRLYIECQKRGIQHINNNEVNQWTDIGDPVRRNKSKFDEKNTYAFCWLKDVTSLIDGKLFRCEKIYVLDNLGRRKMSQLDYVDVKNASVKQLRKGIKKLYRIRTLDACNFCNNNEDRVIIPSGVQVKDTI